MGRIRKLDEKTVNRIAAGEVVERPASVLKELVENSLDAAAQSVTVTVNGGGLSLIEVADDGKGMEPDDIPLALLRHTTSKIFSFEDITRVDSFGFRGEALASIAAVSKLTIISIPKDSEKGLSLTFAGGKIVEEKPVYGNRGTTVRVEDLFASVPARKKFMKSRRVEVGHLRDMFWNLAIPAVGVSFTYREEGEEIASVGKALPFLERVKKREGEMGDLFLPVEEVSPYYVIRGLITPPVKSYSTPGKIHTYVNKRAVREGVVIAALRDGVRGFLPAGRYPASYLSIEVDPEEVDINVHPSKREARFRYRKELYEITRHLVRRRYTKEKPHPPGRSPVTHGRDGGSFRDVAAGSGSMSFPEKIPAEWKGEGPARYPSQEELPRLFSKMKYVGQILGNYLLLDGGEEIYFVDIHAAAERIEYLRIMEGREEWLKRPESLLTTVTVPKERLLGYGEEVAELLAEAGYSLEERSGAIVISGTPPYLKKLDPLDVVDDIVELVSLDFGPFGGKAEGLFEELVKKMACHGSLRGAPSVHSAEFESLLRDLESAIYSDTCPHGRPTYIKITREEMNGWFKR